MLCAADAATEAVAALSGQTVAAREAFEETSRRVGTDVAGLREASAKYERAARAASEEVLRQLRSPWRPWLAAPVAVAAAAGVLFLGALAQQEFGDGLRRNAYVAKRYASPIAYCAAKAKLGRLPSESRAAGGCRGAVPPRGRPVSRESPHGAVAWSRRSRG